MTNRILEYWVGAQRSGKTYQLRSLAARRARRASIRSVIVVAPPGEWRDMAPIMSPRDLAECYPLPQIACVDVGTADATGELEGVLATARWWGDCYLVIDEAWRTIPAGPTLALESRQPLMLDSIVRGRHLERADGELRPLHLSAAAQAPHTASHVLRDQAYVIMAGRLHGSSAHGWIRSVAGDEGVRRVQRLGDLEWTSLRGRDPRRG